MIAVAIILFDGRASASHAQSASPPQPKYGWQEVWAGADATKDVWLLYSGVTLAPLSADIHSNGLRLRAAGGYGQYSYTRDKSNVGSGLCGNPGQDNCQTTRQKFNVSHTYVEAFVGYQQRIGELTAKAFVGIASIDHSFDRLDLTNDATGSDIGVKGSIELWLNLGHDAWTSLDVSYTSAHKTAAARSRLGWRVLPTISVGPELRYDSNVEDDSFRGGGFVRYEWFGGEISASGGVGNGALKPNIDDAEIYGTMNVVLQY